MGRSNTLAHYRPMVFSLTTKLVATSRKKIGWTLIFGIPAGG
jgi:hypothetical protein